MSAYLRLEDNEGNFYNFPSSFWITEFGWQNTQNIVNKAYAAGGRDISDNNLQARTITIEGALRADSLQELETLKRNLEKALQNAGKLSKSDDVVSRYIIVTNPLVDSNDLGDYRLEIPYTISFIVEYPFWQDTTQTEDINIITGNTEFTIDNRESDYLVLPIIEIEADQGANLPGIKITNKSDGGMAFEYNDPDFVIGDTLIIDSINGTVKRNNNSTIEYFNPAKFIRLQNLNNIIAYEGNACTITFKFRKVYL